MVKTCLKSVKQLMDKRRVQTLISCTQRCMGLYREEGKVNSCTLYHNYGEAKTQLVMDYFNV